MTALSGIGGALLLIGIILILATVYNGVGWALVIIGALVVVAGLLFNSASRSSGSRL